MPDRPALNETPGAQMPGARTPDAEAQVGEGYSRLLGLLADHEPTDPAVVDVRARQAVAVARAGRLDEALYQVDELVKDAERASGPEDATAVVAREAQAQVRELAGFPAEG